jgi:prevent-host-death family protein
MLGLTCSTIGKTQARQQFLPLVEELHKTSSAIEITDHEKPVAILLSYSHWVALMSKLAMLAKPEKTVKPPNLVGSVEIVGDLDAASKKAAAKFSASLKKTTEKL